jgi:putative transposase
MSSTRYYPSRRRIRLPGYDYCTPGAYFVTVCTWHRALILEDAGRAAAVLAAWKDLAEHYDNVVLDEFVVMPNHIHGIIFLAPAPDPGNQMVGAGFKPARPAWPVQNALPEIVRAFKTFSARSINAFREAPHEPVWQRGYYEHVIRSGRTLDRVRQYIAANPDRWALDRENPAGTPDTVEAAFWAGLDANSPHLFSVGVARRAGLKPAPTEAQSRTGAGGARNANAREEQRCARE